MVDKKNDLNLIYGVHALEEFVLRHPEMIKQIWTSHTDDQMLDDKKFVVKKVSSKKLDEMFIYPINHQGYVAEIKEYNYLPFLDLVEATKKEEKDVVLVLDEIHDPYNFGAILRSAVLLNVKHVIILDRKQVMVTPTVVKTSAGTAYDLKISKVPNLFYAIETLKEAGYWVYASNLNEDAVDVRKVKFSAKTALVIGNEEKGVGLKLTKHADANIFLASTKKIDSYNASVAAALLMYEISTKLKLI